LHTLYSFGPCNSVNIRSIYRADKIAQKPKATTENKRKCGQTAKTTTNKSPVIHYHPIKQ
jgi:hypothetical protein